jgi:hypothetical protein
MTSSYAQSNKLKLFYESGETYVKGFVRGQFGHVIWYESRN